MAILIVTDNPTLNIGLRTIIIGEFPDISIFEAETLQKTLTSTTEQSVETMILDVGVSDGKDMALLEKFKLVYPQAAVVVYLGDQFEHIYAFAKAGITALVSRKSDAVEIAEALHRAARKGRFISFDIQQILLSHIAAGTDNRRKS